MKIGIATITAVNLIMSVARSSRARGWLGTDFLSWLLYLYGTGPLDILTQPLGDATGNDELGSVDGEKSVVVLWYEE